MALVVICGLPCSGKSTFSGRLLDRMSATSAPTVIDEPSLHLNRDESYRGLLLDSEARDSAVSAILPPAAATLPEGRPRHLTVACRGADATAEKRTRGQLKAAVDRALAKGRIVFLDSINSIKGYRSFLSTAQLLTLSNFLKQLPTFPYPRLLLGICPFLIARGTCRYEIWCLARAAGVKYCLVHCITPAATAQQWNRARQASSYSEAVFSDLAGRFESPDSKNRWEQPLFSVLPCGDDADTEASLQVWHARVRRMASVYPNDICLLSIRGHGHVRHVQADMQNGLLQST